MRKPENKKVMVAQTTNRFGWMRYSLFAELQNGLPAFSITEQEKGSNEEWGPEVTINSDANPSHECVASFLGCLFARIVGLERRVTYLATQGGAHGADIHTINEQIEKIVEDFGLNFMDDAAIDREIVRVTGRVNEEDEGLMINCVDG